MSVEEQQILIDLLNTLKQNNLLLQQQNELLKIQLQSAGLTQQQPSANEQAFEQVERLPGSVLR